MKCKHCDGTGTTNWCVNGTFKECPYCGGTGEVDRFNAVDVLKVMEMVKKLHTNEEWFCQLPTEEKAKRIINIAVNSDCDYRTIVEWLKQPHQGE